jgi:hypothetical protein
VNFVFNQPVRRGRVGPPIRFRAFSVFSWFINPPGIARPTAARRVVRWPTAPRSSVSHIAEVSSVRGTSIPAPRTLAPNVGPAARLRPEVSALAQREIRSESRRPERFGSIIPLGVCPRSLKT